MEILRDIDSRALPVFAKESFLESKSENYGWFKDKDMILPFIIDKRLIFSRLIFTNGIISKREITLNEEKYFLDTVVNLCRTNLRVDFIAKPQANAVFNSVPSNSIFVEWGTYQKDINLSEDDLMMSLKSKTRNMVRKAIKDGLKVEKATIDELYNSLFETFKRQKQELLIPDKNYLLNLEDNLGSNFLTLKCVKNKKIQCVVGIPHDSNIGYYLYGGTLRRPSSGAMNFLQFKTMIFLKNKGIKIYDFVGARINVSKDSKYYGIQRFKESFNAELKKGYNFKVVLNPLKYKLFNLIVSLVYSLKGAKYKGDPIDQILKEK